MTTEVVGDDTGEESRPEQGREIFGWQMYDWAISAFSTTIVTALLGPYLLALAERTDGVSVLGFRVAAASFFPFAVSTSAILQVIFLPVVGAVADHTPHKKRLMMGLSYAASALVAALFLVTADTILLGGILFVLAAACFGAASVIYNSFLPDIAPPDRRDRVSSVGFAYGYLGGGLWLAANFALIIFMDDTELAVRISLGGTGIWCLVFFALYPGRLLRPRPARRVKPEGAGWVRFSVRSVLATLADMRRNNPHTLRFLVAYLLFTDGTGTVVIVATSFAADELDAESETLLALVLLIQFVAIPGSLGFGRMAEWIGAKKSLLINLVVWMGLVIYAFAALDTIAELWVLGVALAVVLGGSLAISRSLFAQMIPANREAEYFGFYEIAARGTSWLGPAVFGIVNQVVGSQRMAILSLIIFFGLGIAILATVKVRDAMLDAGQDPTGLVL
ncbi:MAG: MFS transporter [Actinomycetia bacterium]|nr:MFS transporter [Actinomycetes bacterium]